MTFPTLSFEARELSAAERFEWLRLPTFVRGARTEVVEDPGANRTVHELLRGLLVHVVRVACDCGNYYFD